MPDNPFDQFDGEPVPTKEGSLAPPRTEIVKGAPMSTVGALPQPTEQDQQEAARGARETAAKVPRQRVERLREYNWMSTPPQQPDAQEGGNPFDKFDKGPQDDGVELMERMRLNRVDAFYRGSVAGSTQLALLAKIYQSQDGPEVDPDRKRVNEEKRQEYRKVLADLAAYDEMQPYSTTLEGMVSLGGQLEGTLISPESWIGWGAKGANWGIRMVKAGVQQAGIQIATDPIVQGLDMYGGVQEDYDYLRTLLSGAAGLGIGAGGHALGEAAGHVAGRFGPRLVGQRELRKQLYELSSLDPGFDAPQMAQWALDPANGIRIEDLRPTLTREAPAPVVPEERYGAGPEHGFDEAVKAEQQRISDSAGAAQPRRARLKEEAQFSAFNKEVGPQVETVLAEHGFRPEEAQDLYKFYDRQPGEHPNAALERAITSWYEDAERAALSDAMLDSEFAREFKVLQDHFEAELEKPLDEMRYTDFRGRETTFAGETPRAPRARAAEQDIPFESGVPSREGGVVPEGGRAQPGEARGAVEGGAAGPTGGERGGERLAAEAGRGERVEGPALTAEEKKARFEEWKAKMRAEEAAAQKILDDALAQTPIRLELVKGDRTKLISANTTEGVPYRITDFDAAGPSGHREYKGTEKGVYSLLAEVKDALREGYTVKQGPRAAEAPRGERVEGPSRTIKDLKGNDIEAPRVFYRGTNLGDERRIKTGNEGWDSHLFVADSPEGAKWYGDNVERIVAAPDASILYEGTQEWNRVAGKWRKNESMLDYAARAAEKAKAAGYDAAWFKRQTDIGTAIFNPEKFERERPLSTERTALGEGVGGPTEQQFESRIAKFGDEHVPNHIYRGTGRGNVAEAYNGVAVPIAGPGQYWSFNREHASTFGPNVEEGRTVAVVRNPLVIHDGNVWRALTKEAGWEFPNPFGKSEAEVKAMTDRLKAVVEAKGHDGLVVEWDQSRGHDIGPKGENWKLLRNVFGEPQVVSYREPLRTERTAQGEQTLIPGVEPVTDKQRAEAGMAKPLAGGAKGMPEGGLFDEGARAQTDMFSGRAIPEGEPQGIAQRRKGGKMEGEPTRQPVAAGEERLSPAKENAVRSLQQQAMDLAEALDFPLREGRVRSRKHAGEFYPRSGVVRVREVPDFDVVSHEAGHALEARIGAELTDFTKAHAVELKPLDYDQGPNGKRVNEGFAEAVRYMMTNPEYLAKRAPNFNIEFRQFMAARAPDLLQKIDAAAVAFKAYNDAPSVDAVGSVVRSVHEEPGVTEKIKESMRLSELPNTINAWGQKVYDGLFDENSPFDRWVREMGRAIKARTGEAVELRAADNPAVLLRLAERSRQAATLDLQYGVRGYHQITSEGSSLIDAIAAALGEQSWWGKFQEGKRKDFSAYLVARRAEYLWRKFEAGEIPNPPVAFSKGDAVQAMTDLQRFYPQFQAASDMVHGYTRQILKKAFDGGLITPDRYAKLLEEEFYVPFMRDRSDKPIAGSGMGQGAEGPGTTAIVQRLRGSARDIIDPLESIMGQTFLIERTLAHNDIVKSMVRLSERAGEKGGKYVEAIPAHEARLYTADLEQAIENRAKEIGMDVDDARDLIAALGGLEGEAITGNYFHMERTASRGEPIVFYREGGELRAVRVMSKEEGMPLYELLTAAPPTVTDLWANIVASAGAIKRSSIITNPTFAITNYMRDQVAASLLRNDYIPFYSGAKGMVDEFRQGNNAVLYGYAGGVAGGRSVGVVDKAVEKDINALAHKGYAVNRVPSLKELMELASFTEAGTRNSVFGAVFEASKRKGLSDYEAMVEAAYQAQDLMDFSRHGSQTLWVRRFLPFFNAHLQGLDKARRVMIEPITNRIRDGQVFTRDSADFSNAITTWMKAGALGTTLGAIYAAVMSDKEAYKDASPYLKGTHLVVPFGNKLYVVPKPFEMGMGFTMGEYAYHMMAEKDPRSARMLAEAAWDVFMPPNPISDMPIVTPAIETITGKSLFTGRDIVPEQIQKLPAPQQFTDRTSELAKWLGKETGLSPIKIDYAIGSQFATWGRDVMALSQGVNENAPAASLDDMVFFRRFVKDPTRSSDITTRFWNYMGQTTGKYNQDVAGYRDMVREAITRGQSLDDANNFLAKLPAGERTFVTLKEGAKPDGKPAFSPDIRRLHPMQHAYDAVTLLNSLRRELSTNAVSTFAGRTNIQLNPEQRRLLLENVRELTQMEMRNSMVILGEGGFANRPVLDPNDTMDKIRAISPEVADEIATRYATAKIYQTPAIRAAWPRLRDELLRNGTNADLGTLVFDARSEGYQFAGARSKKPPVRRAPIVPTAAPAPQP